MARSQYKSKGRNEGPSVIDILLLQPISQMVVKIMSFAPVRFCSAALLFPLFLFLAFCRDILPYALKNTLALLTASGRAKLIRQGKGSREWRDQTAASQLNGTFRFSRKDVEGGGSHVATQKRLNEFWPMNREFFEVCGVRVCVVHEKPAETAKRQVVLVHGNPSWSYMYRNVLPQLVDQGCEVFALDLVGMGASEKILDAKLLTFELQMRAMIQLYETYNLQDTYVLAHDWGGCVALCTIPDLPSNACSGLLLLNSFFPARPSDISLHCYLLYICWLSCQGLFDGFVPEEMIMRYMAPKISAQVAQGFAAPFSSAKTKTAVTSLACFVPGMPDFVYRVFESDFGALIDGLCPTSSFSRLWTQLRLRTRDESVRAVWASGTLDVTVEVAFGDQDPLLIDFFNVLVDTIETKLNRPTGYWINGAGHYPTEEKPDNVAELFAGLVALRATKNESA